MPVNLSIKNVPEALADALRVRAERNHRSMQGEMMAILEAALLPPAAGEGTDPLERLRRAGVQTADDALALMRHDAAPGS